MLEALIASEMPVSWREDTQTRMVYHEALCRSSLKSMLAYYQQNYPYPPYTYQEPQSPSHIEAPVLQFHGLEDKYLLASGLNDTWKWIARDWTLITFPGVVGHNIHHHAPEFTRQARIEWLAWHTPT
ncbi:alpha/beta fold hydrolase [Ktedonobacter racemifer]|uniref:Hydrolase, alpha/beta fold family n=1 Tax=Ktedonobacter racemifer DSM 44963 TaxID=485913 RepID=D6TT45_KTERA|nr:alpha/beta hydrolase [Ktedonobacter racemifer]EFH83596.1 hydrolase, alpha/beta fold family [Ktedonobacter racemifer DSM 44963]